MKWRTLAALLVLAAPAAAVDAAEPDAVAAIDACLQRLDAQLDVGYERIARRCPDLAPALEGSGFAAWLPQGWKESRNDLSAGSLRELRALVTRELATRAATRTPRVTRLKEILTELGSTGQQRSGAWYRFKKWLRSLFERAGQQNRESWLSRLVSRVGVSDAAIQIITYVALGLVVALALLIVFNELRLAGLLGRRADRPRERERAARGAGSPLKWSEVERAPLIDQPRLMLELIAARLTHLQRLPPAGAFTVREIVRAASLSEAGDRERLKQLALTAERVRYAQERVSPTVVESVVGHARELLAHLESPDGTAPSPAGAGA